jgi:hypothetical protein
MNWPQVEMKARIIADFRGNCPTGSKEFPNANWGLPICRWLDGLLGFE